MGDGHDLIGLSHGRYLLGLGYPTRKAYVGADVGAGPAVEEVLELEDRVQPLPRRDWNRAVACDVGHRLSRVLLRWVLYEEEAVLLELPA